MANQVYPYKTAREEYEARQVNISSILKTLDMKMKSHNHKASMDQKNWGFAGDLGFVEEQLKNIVDHFMVG